MLLLQIGNHRKVVGPKGLIKWMVYRGLSAVGLCGEKGYIQREINLHNRVVDLGHEQNNRAGKRHQGQLMQGGEWGHL